MALSKPQAKNANISKVEYSVNFSFATLAAYLHQSVNLVVGVATVLLMLRYLGINEYILWSLFIAFGGLTLQVENSIQMLAVRDIARQHHGWSKERLKASLVRATRMYQGFASMVAGPLATVGILYLYFMTAENTAADWKFEWAIFIIAYTINYWFGTNNAVLLATDRLAIFSIISTCTRIIHFALSWALLAHGWAVLGLCISFAMGVFINVIVMRFSANWSLRQSYQFAGKHANQSEGTDANTSGITRGNLLHYTIVAIAAFALYRGSILMATAFFQTEVVAQYALAIQAFGMIATLALVPINLWLASLVRAVLADNVIWILRELARTLLAVNLCFVVCGFLLMLAGDILLVSVGSELILPPGGTLALVGIAFLIEANLFVLINFFITRNSYTFTSAYLGATTLAMGGALSASMLGAPMEIALLIVPICIQCCLSLPLLLRLLAKELNIPLRCMPSIVFSLLSGRA